MTAVDLASGRSAEELLAWSRDLVEPYLRTVVDGLPGPIREIAGYHFGWWDESGAPDRRAGGKAFRPALVLLSATAVGEPDPAAVVPAAGAVELVHNFSLLHDDVMDHDHTRRHRATAWSVYGVGPAILAGDALLSLAFECLADAPDSARSLASAVQDLLAGQRADLTFEERLDVELAECIEMAEQKTGALLRSCCALGAMQGGGAPEQVEALSRFGERLGLAYQFADDHLGIWGDPVVTGKPVYSDLLSRKKSLPVVMALTSSGPRHGELLAWFERTDPLSHLDVERLAELLERIGAKDWCRRRSVELLDEALGELDRADPAGCTAQDLAALAELAVRRDR